MLWNVPRIILSGLAGGCGKTLVSTGIIAALKKSGKEVFPFKKGPDYIDAAWLSSAAQKPCYNLDAFLTSEAMVRRSFERHIGISEVCRYCSEPSCSNCSHVTEFLSNKIAVIEGNRGLFDGMDENGTYSTAELAKAVKTPVILVVDSTKATRTIAAEVLGCQRMDVTVPLAGVILNRVAGKRHEDIVRSSIEKTCGVPVIGALPKFESNKFPERHLGLITPEEYPEIQEAIKFAAQAIASYVDRERLLKIAGSGKPLFHKKEGRHSQVHPARADIKVGIIRDRSFSFYYPENIEALRQCGADVVEINALANTVLPDIDALYIGGGFPETSAAQLAKNASFRTSVREAVEDGLPVYAECGGAIFMGTSLTYLGTTYPMTGILPVEFYFEKRPQGHGYTVLEVVSENPYFSSGCIIHGHEFHYSRAVILRPEMIRYAFKLHKGAGFNRAGDGICYKNMLAVYSHIHAGGVPQWAENLVRTAREYAGTGEKDKAGRAAPDSLHSEYGRAYSGTDVEDPVFNIQTK